MRKITVKEIEAIVSSKCFAVVQGGRKGETWETIAASSPSGSFLLGVKPKKTYREISISVWDKKVFFKRTPYGIVLNGNDAPDGALLIRAPKNKGDYGYLSCNSNPKSVSLEDGDKVNGIAEQLKVIFQPLVEDGRITVVGYFSLFKPRVNSARR